MEVRRVGFLHWRVQLNGAILLCFSIFPVCILFSREFLLGSDGGGGEERGAGGGEEMGVWCCRRRWGWGWGFSTFAPVFYEGRVGWRGSGWGEPGLINTRSPSFCGSKRMGSLSFSPHLSITRSRTPVTETARNPRWGFVNFKKVQANRGFPFKSSLVSRLRKENEIVGDKDGIIIVDHGSRRQESNLMLNEFVAMFREKTNYPIVELAHMELAEPSIKVAFNSCVQQGANRIVVSPFFLSPGRHWHQDIPSLTAEAAKEHPGISYVVTAPLGLHKLLVDVVNDRINHCLSHVAGSAYECDVCAGTGRCKLHQSKEQGG